MSAIQQAVDSRWGRDNTALAVAVAVSRASTRIRVTDQKLFDGYVAFVQETIAAMFKP